VNAELARAIESHVRMPALFYASLIRAFWSVASKVEYDFLAHEGVLWKLIASRRNNVTFSLQIGFFETTRVPTGSLAFGAASMASDVEARVAPPSWPRGRNRPAPRPE
jgi:hypothetical protein